MTYNVFGGTLNLTLIMERGACRTGRGVRVFYVEQALVFSAFHCARSPFLLPQT